VCHLKQIKLNYKIRLNQTNATNVKTNDNLTFNITVFDSVSLSSYIFSWNGTGNWDNLTNGSITRISTKLVINKSVTLSQGNTIGYRWYANDSADNWNTSLLRTFTLSNTLPTHLTPLINSSDIYNRTNGTIYCYNQSTYDADDDLVTNNYRWFNNTKLLSGIITNHLGEGNFSKGDNITCEITPNDSLQDGTSLNSTNLTILNANLTISLTAPQEELFTRDTFNFSYEVSDIDGINDIDTCWLWLEINDSGTWELNDTNNNVAATNGVIYNVSDPQVEKIDWLINCTDGETVIKTIERTIHVDTINPIANFYNPKANNLTVQKFSNKTFKLDVRVANTNLSNVTLIIINSSNATKHLNQSGTLPGIKWYNMTYNVSTTSWESGNYTVIVNATDLANNNLTIHKKFRINAPPTTSLAEITSSDLLNRSNGTITGSYTYSDSDYDSESSYQTRWYNNSIHITTLDNVLTVGKLNLTKGQNWTFSVRTYDGYDYSTWINSTNITIINSAPEIPTIYYPVNGENYSNILYINYSSADNDNDAITYNIYINNTLNITTTTNVTTWNASDGYYNLTVSATDNTDSSSNSSVIYFRLDSTKPSWSLNQTNATLMRINGNATFNITITDNYELDSYIFSWNGTGEGWLNDSTIIISSTSQPVSINKSTNLTQGNTIGYRWYANDSANNWNSSILRAFTVLNTPPNTPTVTYPINSQSYTSITEIKYNTTDADNDEITYNVYVNNTINISSHNQHVFTSAIPSVSATVYVKLNVSLVNNSSPGDVKEMVKLAFKIVKFVEFNAVP